MVNTLYIHKYLYIHVLHVSCIRQTLENQVKTLTYAPRITKCDLKSELGFHLDGLSSEVITMILQLQLLSNTNKTKEITKSAPSYWNSRSHKHYKEQEAKTTDKKL